MYTSFMLFVDLSTHNSCLVFSVCQANIKTNENVIDLDMDEMYQDNTSCYKINKKYKMSLRVMYVASYVVKITYDK